MLRALSPLRYLDAQESEDLLGEMMSKNSFNAKKNLEVAGKSYEIFDISGIEGATSLPFSLKVLLENLLRTEDGANITADHIKALANWNPAAEPDTEIQFTPARVLMQDFTGVPCIVDLATMREAIVDLGGDPSKVNPLTNRHFIAKTNAIIKCPSTNKKHIIWFGFVGVFYD